MLDSLAETLGATRPSPSFQVMLELYETDDTGMKVSSGPLRSQNKPVIPIILSRVEDNLTLIGWKSKSPGL